MVIPIEDLNAIAEGLNEFERLQFQNRTVLLCGGSGFLGMIFKSLFLYMNQRYLLNTKVISVDNYITGTCPKDIEGENLVNLTHDLSQPLGLKIGANQNIDFILNCSGLASPQGYSKYPLETLDISYLGTRHLLELAYQKNSIAYLAFSSSEIYGTPPDHLIPTPETYWGSFDGFGKRAPYDTGKKVIETLCWTFNSKYGVNTKIVRPFNVYGYMAQNDFRVLPNFMNAVLKNEKIKVYGDGKQTRTFCWFTDFITGAIKVLLKGKNEPYNIGNQENEISMIDLGKMIEKITNKPNLVQMISTPSAYVNEPLRRCPDISKARTEIGYNPVVDVETGIRKFYEWAKKSYVY
jgi:UDP-glucuronate decarboxylase